MSRPILSVAFFYLLHIVLFYVPFINSSALYEPFDSALLVKRTPAEIYCPAPLPPHTPPNSPPSDRISVTYPSRFPISRYKSLDDLCWARTTGRPPNRVIANAGCQCVYVGELGWRPQCFSPPGAEELTNNEGIRTYCIVHCECWEKEVEESPPPELTSPRMKYPNLPVVEWNVVCASLGRPAQEEARGEETVWEDVPADKRKVGSAYCSLADTAGCCKAEKCVPVGEVTRKGVLEVLMGFVATAGSMGLGSCVAGS